MRYCTRHLAATSGQVVQAFSIIGSYDFNHRKAQSARDSWSREFDDRGLTFSTNSVLVWPYLQSVNRITDIHTQVDAPDSLIALQIVQANCRR